MSKAIDGRPEQDLYSCGVVITGLAYQYNFQVNHKSLELLNDRLLLLAKEALLDDGSATDSVERTYVVFSGPKSGKLSTEKILVSLNLKSDGLDYFAETSVAAVKFAVDNLKAKSCDAVLLLLCEPLVDIENKSESFVATALVLRCRRHLKNKNVYAAIPLAASIVPPGDLDLLRREYEKAGILVSSLDLLALESNSTDSASADIGKLGEWLKDTAKIEVGGGINKNKSWCALSLRGVGFGGNGLSLLLDTILSIYQRRFLPAFDTTLEPIDLSGTPFYFNLEERPWFFPQIHPYFGTLSSYLTKTESFRRAALQLTDSNLNVCHLVFEEYADAAEIEHKSLGSDWDSEVFLFFAENNSELLNYLHHLESFVAQNHSFISLGDVACTVDTDMNQFIARFYEKHPLPEQENNCLRVAFVASNLADLIDKVRKIKDVCLRRIFPEENEKAYFESEGIYFRSKTLRRQKNKLAFVLPGLGAAYPNMLVDLCLHFPEIRAIFDYVDYLAVSNGSKIKPSDRIFCRIDPRTGAYKETPASLAMMDSAVVSVLMAEWALFTLLLNLDIVPDVLLGSSTGEFAALSMSGAVDLFKSAPLFYHLSTGMVHALPVNQLVNLRSLRINDSYEAIEADLNKYKNKIFLSANLSPKQVILTGERDSINSLLKTLENKNISADFLPFAIPYHTSLVEGVISTDNPDIEALEINKPLIESWSCSLAAPYPSSSDEIKKMTTDLFSRPILFRESIEALYADGVGIFVEVGPRGNLTTTVTDILGAEPHVSLAANRSDKPAILQLQILFAILFVNDVHMNLSYLYTRRSKRLLPLFEKPEAKQESGTLLIDKQTYGDYSLRLENDLIPDVLAITRSFEQQLAILEKQVLSVLKQESGKNIIALNKEIVSPSELPIEKIFTNLTHVGNISCCYFSTESIPKQEKEFEDFIEEVLNPLEKKQLYSFPREEKRFEWLSGRIAVKQAVKILISRLAGWHINYADIEIQNADSGKPYIAKIQGTENREGYPLISIAHKDGSAIGMAVNSTKFDSVGIDLETILQNDELENMILAPSEKKHLVDMPISKRGLYLTKVWAAKEAVAKVLGVGLGQCLTKLTVSKLEESKSLASVLYEETNPGSKVKGVVEYKVHLALLENKVISLALI